MSFRECAICDAEQPDVRPRRMPGHYWGERAVTCCGECYRAALGHYREYPHLADAWRDEEEPTEENP